jgi:hypothetical protein
MVQTYLSFQIIIVHIFCWTVLLFAVDINQIPLKYLNEQHI